MTYEGSEQWGAMWLTTQGFLATAAIGAILTLTGAPILLTLAVGVAAGVYFGTKVKNEKIIRYGYD